MHTSAPLPAIPTALPAAPPPATIEIFATPTVYTTVRGRRTAGTCYLATDPAGRRHSASNLRAFTRRLRELYPGIRVTVTDLRPVAPAAPRAPRPAPPAPAAR